MPTATFDAVKKIAVLTDDERRARLEEAASRLGGKAMLGRRLGYVDGAFVGQMLRGQRPITEKTIRALADLREVADLFAAHATPGDGASAPNTAGHANTSPVSDVYRLVPVISSVQAGAWRDVHDPYPPGVSDVWIPCPSKHGPNTFALRVEGDSMDAPGGYREGEIVFVDPAVHAVPGKDVVVRTPDGRATLKRLKADAEGPYLMALNPHWPTRILRMPEGTVICGVVIGSYIER